jgi:hypothetical protein
MAKAKTNTDPTEQEQQVGEQAQGEAVVPRGLTVLRSLPHN